MTSRHLLRPLAAASLTAIALACGVTISLPAPADAASSSLTVRPALAGETTTASGKVTRAARPRVVSLQRHSSRGWRTVRTARTTRAGSFSLRLTEPAAATKYRVVAAKTGRTARTVTPTRVAQPLSQKASLSLPAGARPSSSTEATVAFSPARPGRPFVLERLDVGRWVKVASGKQPTSGRTTVVAPTPGRGVSSYRTTTMSWRGARAATSPIRIVHVDEPDVVSRSYSTLLDRDAEAPASDAAGRYLALATNATNTAFPNPRGELRLFLRDMDGQGLTVIARNPGSKQPAGGNSRRPSLSADGRLVAYESSADDIVANDDNKKVDVFLWDRFTQESTLLSTGDRNRSADAESLSPSISPNGRYVAWETAAQQITHDPQARSQVILLDRETGTRIVASRGMDGQPGRGSSWQARVTDSGKVAFVSIASDLVADDTNAQPDVFLYDPATNGTTGISTMQVRGSQTFDIDGTGDRIVYPKDNGTPNPTNQLWRYDRDQPSPVPGRPGARISDDGDTIAYSGTVEADGRSVTGVLVLDVPSGRSVLVSRPHPGGVSSQDAYLSSISGDGAHAFFAATGTDFVGTDANGRYHQVRAAVRW